MMASGPDFVNLIYSPDTNKNKKKLNICLGSVEILSVLSIQQAMMLLNLT